MTEKNDFNYTANIQLNKTLTPSDEGAECRIIEMSPLAPFFVKWQKKLPDETVISGEGVVYLDFYNNKVYENLNKVELTPLIEKSILDVIASKKAHAVDKSLILSDDLIDQVTSNRRQMKESIAVAKSEQELKPSN